METKYLKFMVILLFFAGTSLFILSISATMNSNLITLVDDLHKGRVLEMVGTLCLTASIIGATQLKKDI